MAPILLLDVDPASTDVIAGGLVRAGHELTTVTDSDEALRRVLEHQLVIVDVVTGERTAPDVCREIRGTPDMAAVPVLCIAQTAEVDERIAFLEAGADDVLTKPFDDRELEARVEALLLRFQRSRDFAPTAAVEGPLPAPRRRLAAVFSPKGGVGTTTIATNVAMVHAQHRPDRVLLVDLDLQFGQVSTHLNLGEKLSLADAVRDDGAMRDPELLGAYATRHESGLHVLASPGTPEPAAAVSARHVDRLLDLVLSLYDIVVVDAGATVDDRLMVVLNKADVVLLPVYPEIPALKAVHSFMELMAETTPIIDKTSFVLNNMFAREILRMRDVESALGTRVAANLPYDPFLYLKAVNEGVPVVLGAPRSAPAVRLSALAEGTFAAQDPGRGTTGSDQTARKGRGLGGLLRRG